MIGFLFIPIGKVSHNYRYVSNSPTDKIDPHFLLVGKLGWLEFCFES